MEATERSRVQFEVLSNDFIKCPEVLKVSCVGVVVMLMIDVGCLPSLNGKLLMLMLKRTGDDPSSSPFWTTGSTRECEESNSTTIFDWPIF